MVFLNFETNNHVCMYVCMYVCMSTFIQEVKGKQSPATRIFKRCLVIEPKTSIRAANYSASLKFDIRSEKKQALKTY